MKDSKTMQLAEFRYEMFEDRPISDETLIKLVNKNFTYKMTTLFSYDLRTSFIDAIKSDKVSHEDIENIENLSEDDYWHIYISDHDDEKTHEILNNISEELMYEHNEEWVDFERVLVAVINIEGEEQPILAEINSVNNLSHSRYNCEFGGDYYFNREDKLSYEEFKEQMQDVENFSWKFDEVKNVEELDALLKVHNTNFGLIYPKEWRIYSDAKEKKKIADAEKFKEDLLELAENSIEALGIFLSYSVSKTVEALKIPKHIKNVISKKKTKKASKGRTL